MTQFNGLFKKELRTLLSSGDGLFILFLMPLVFILIMSSTATVPEGFNAAQYTVPGLTIFGIFFIMPYISFSLLNEKKNGTSQRLLAAPVNTGTLLIGKLVPYFVINLIQIALMFTVGVLVFGYEFPPTASGFVGLLFLCIMASLVAIGLSMVFATITDREENASGLGSLSSIIFAATGGSFFSVDDFPAILQTISYVSPHRWVIEGAMEINFGGGGLPDVLGELGVLLAMALVLFTIARFRFKYRY